MTEAHLEQGVKKFVDKLSSTGGKPLYELTPEQARDVLREIQHDQTEAPLSKTQNVNIPLSGGREMPIQIITPLSEADGIIFYIHGGGWVMGDEKTHARLIHQLAESVPAAVVFPIYQPSPEAQYPQTTEDLFEVLQYFSKYADKHGLKSDHLVIAGDSVGGNMATALALMAKQKGFPEIDFQLLFYPVTNAEMNTPSYDEFAEGPWLTKKAMQWFWDQYAPDKGKRSEIFASPLQAASEELKGLPPALIITAENDVLRDEGEAYARKLDQAGVEVASVRINGTIHDFMMLNALDSTLPTRTALALAVIALQDVFAS